MPSSLLSQRPATRWPVYAAAAASVCSIAATTAYALLGFADRVPVTVAHYFAGNALYVLINGTLIYLLWHRRHLFRFTTKAFAIAWAGIFAWWSLPQPLFLVLTISPDPLQTKWMFFTWMWEIPIIGGFLFGGYVLWLLRPIAAYVSGRRQRAATTLLPYVLKYPLLVAASLVAFATLGYFLGALQSYVFGSLPLIESGKVFGQGFVSSLFMAIFYYFAYHWYLRSVRQRLEHQVPQALTVRRHFAWRVFIVTSMITLGSLLYISFVVLQAFQVQLSSSTTARLEHAINRALDELQRARHDPPDAYQALLAANIASLRFGQRGAVVPLAGADNVLASLAQRTQQIITSRDSAVVLDSRYEHKLISVWREPRTGQKMLVITYLSDFYGSVWRSMWYVAAVGSFVSLLSILTTTVASMWLAGSLRALTSAVRHAQGTSAPFTFDTFTVDELEDLAHAFAFYINQANDKSAELADAFERLQEVDRLKTEFISIASHQLRTPLTGIRWVYHALLEGKLGPLNPPQRTLAKSGLEKSTYMIKLVNELLDVSRIEDQKVALTTAAGTLPALIHTVSAALRPQAQQRRVTLQLRLPAAPLPPLKIDAEKMSMVVNNLIDNAIKYTSPGGQVTVSLNPTSRGVRLTVADTGVGIPAGDLPRLFTKFFRAPNAMLMHPNGSGLGLYIAKSIIEKHGGHISAHSREGQGSTFTVFLPTSTP
ncbi:MAG: hypothetical protein HY372_03585 [Candidatus Andersenbacteria bacterium]|nr:hypothetical protein [Candidatus Andersenbacteria bacterium]